MIIPTITNRIFAVSTKGFQDAATNHGYFILFGSIDYSYDRELELVPLFQQMLVDGIVFTGTSGNEKTREIMKRSETPYLVTWEQVQDENIFFVAFDKVKSDRQVTDYLIFLGDRRIGKTYHIRNYLTHNR